MEILPGGYSYPNRVRAKERARKLVVSPTYHSRDQQRLLLLGVGDFGLIFAAERSRSSSMICCFRRMKRSASLHHDGVREFGGFQRMSARIRLLPLLVALYALFVAKQMSQSLRIIPEHLV